MHIRRRSHRPLSCSTLSVLQMCEHLFYTEDVKQLLTLVGLQSVCCSYRSYVKACMNVSRVASLAAFHTKSTRTFSGTAAVSGFKLVPVTFWASCKNTAAAQWRSCEFHLSTQLKQVRFSLFGAADELATRTAAPGLDARPRHYISSTYLLYIRM